MTDNQNELLPIIDEDGTIIDAATRQDCHGGSRKLHPVVHLHVFNSQGELYLQQRPQWKEIQPGRWDTACGGHVSFGESIEQALHREVAEELGITDYTAERIASYLFDSRREREMVYVHTTVYDAPIHPDKDELDGGRFWSLREIDEAIGKGILTPNFESEYRDIILHHLPESAKNSQQTYINNLQCKEKSL